VDSALSTRRKSHLREWLFCLAAAFLVAGCAREIAPVTLTGATMGTTWSVSYIEPAAGSDVEQLWADIQALLDEVNQGMSTYRDESEISVFNRSPIDSPVAVSPDFLRVLQEALAVGAQSEGAYDVTVGPLVDLWGFGPGATVDRVPATDEIAAAMARVGQQYLRVDGDAGTVTKVRDVALDFSSLAKGFAVDRVAGYLSGRGIDRYMVEVGGEMRLSGLSERAPMVRSTAMSRRFSATDMTSVETILKAATATTLSSNRPTISFSSLTARNSEPWVSLQSRTV
jgi:thiamine biosynthesis lipoprotein